MFFPVKRQKFIEIWFQIWVLHRAHENPLPYAVEPPVLMRRLPSEVYAPSDIIRQIFETENVFKIYK